ncbi:MAG: hypothetical protein GC185_08495 [Alphaproteobacteria bacterium]|nr:hypothetical protein [Alphaproteobacteria bacterium]
MTFKSFVPHHFASTFGRVAATVLVLVCFAMPYGFAFADEAPPKTVIPDTAAGIWRSIDQEMDEMSTLVTAGTIGDLHHHAFAVKDLVAALPSHSPELDNTALEQIKRDEKFVAILAERLDKAGDTNDKDMAVSNLAKLKKILKALREKDKESLRGGDVQKDLGNKK